MAYRKSLLAAFISVSLFSHGFSQEAGAGDALPNGEVNSATPETGKSKNEVLRQTWQTLEWEEKEPDAVESYKVLIERYDERRKTYSQVLEVATEDNTPSIKISPQLEPGRYRYKVISMNLIGLYGSESDWKTFTIYKAYEPVINSITTVNLSNILYVDDDNTAEITVAGRNLFSPDRLDELGNFTKYKLVSQNGKIIYDPLAILDTTENGNRIKLDFDFDNIKIAKYNLIAIDASGLESDITPRSLYDVRYKKWMDLNISLGYMPAAIVTAGDFAQYYDPGIFLPMGGIFRLTFLPKKFRKVYIGVGTNLTYTRLDSFKTITDFQIQGNFITTHINFATQFPFYKRRGRFEIYAGVGLQFMASYSYTFENGFGSSPITTARLSYDAGLAVQWFVAAHVYLELNTGFTIIQPMASINDFLIGAVTPSFSVGWQF